MTRDHAAESGARSSGKRGGKEEEVSWGGVDCHGVV